MHTVYSIFIYIFSLYCSSQSEQRCLSYAHGLVHRQTHKVLYSAIWRGEEEEQQEEEEGEQDESGIQAQSHINI